jgi:hypothetical protein
MAFSPHGNVNYFYLNRLEGPLFLPWWRSRLRIPTVSFVGVKSDYLIHMESIRMGDN